jgi:hypothetical protein
MLCQKGPSYCRRKKFFRIYRGKSAQRTKAAVTVFDGGVAKVFRVGDLPR